MYLLQINLQNHTTDIWGVAFDQVAKFLLDMPTTELYMLQYDTKVAADPKHIIKAHFFNKFRFGISITNEIYNSKERCKTKILKATKLDFKIENENLLAQILDIDALK